MIVKPQSQAEAKTDRQAKRVLGRGLSALIPASTRQPDPTGPLSSGDTMSEDGVAGLRYIPLIKITLNPFQPREQFSAEQLNELSESIRQHGVLQPIVVRPKGKSTFELVAGERRFRAATNAGLTQIPAVVREMDDRSSLAIALIENIQRQELNPVESARAYRRLLTEFHLTQVELATEVGKSQPSIANSLRLLSLPDPVINSLAGGAITEGHAKAILSLEGDQERLLLWKLVTKGSLTVRETERRAAAMKAVIPRGIRTGNVQVRNEAFETVQLQETLSLALGTNVKLRHSSPERGHIEIQFYSLDQLDGLLEKFTASDQP